MHTFYPKLVLIDIDGTLVDTVPDLAYSIDMMLTRLDMPKLGQASVRQWVGNGVKRLVQRALTNNIDGYPEPALFERALPIFMEIYHENTSQRSFVYEGVDEGLRYLKSLDNVTLGCATNKPTLFTNQLLQDLGLFDIFDIIVSGDTVPQNKPDPRPLLYACEQTGIAPENSLLIGDSKSDVKAARAANFNIICVSYGYNHGRDIHLEQPDAVIDNMNILSDLIHPST